MSSLLVEVIGKGRSSLIRRTFPLSVSLQIFLHIDPKYSHEKSPKHAKFKILLEICNVHSSRAVCSKCKIHLNGLLMASLLLITIIIILIVIRDQGRRRQQWWRKRWRDGDGWGAGCSFRFSRFDLVQYLGRGHFFGTRQMFAFVLNIGTTFVFLNQLHL